MQVSSIYKPSGADLLLTRRTGPLSKLIRWGQSRRSKQFSWATHTGILISETEVVEALGHGVVISPLSNYDGVEHVIVPVNPDEAVQRRIIDFALHAVGRRYGYFEIMSLGLFLAFKTKLRFARDNQLICSALAAEALSRQFIFPFEPLWAMPADLAEFFDVRRSKIQGPSERR